MHYSILVSRHETLRKTVSLLPKLRYNCDLLGIKSNKNIIDKSLVEKN
ncbi:MAG: hypothetical protein CM15mP53_08200 [Ectothiorhodospiraceae bacterium]|nr:MAG: hypothetical protein CM15mP53_08200 [Ectothiorhodospiraceae bacterium]